MVRQTSTQHAGTGVLTWPGWGAPACLFFGVRETAGGFVRADVRESRACARREPVCLRTSTRTIVHVASSRLSSVLLVAAQRPVGVRHASR